MEEMNKIRSREEIPAEDKWAIEDLYASDEAWEQELAALKDDQQLLSGFSGKLGDSPESLYAYLENMERVNEKIELLANYCMRKADEDFEQSDNFN